MKLKLLLVVLVVTASLLCAGCVSPDDEGFINGKTFDKIDSSFFVKLYVDKETGVNYLFFQEGMRSGQSGVTPRYNQDGSLYVSDV